MSTLSMNDSWCYLTYYISYAGYLDFLCYIIVIAIKCEFTAKCNVSSCGFKIQSISPSCKVSR